jgi:hypothetical protein
VRAAIDPHDQGGSGGVDLEVTVVSLCHEGCFPCDFVGGVEML